MYYARRPDSCSNYPGRDIDRPDIPVIICAAMAKDIAPKRLQFWLGIAVSIACLAAIFMLIDPREIFEALLGAHYGYVALTAAGIVAFLLLRAVRWQFMLGAAPLRRVFHIQNIGYLLTYILPFRLGDVGRAVLIGNTPPVTVAQGISTMVVERVLDLLFIVLLLPLTVANVQAVDPAIRDAACISTIVAVIAVAGLILAANFRDQALALFRNLASRLPFINPDRWAIYAGQLLDGLSSLTRLRDALFLVTMSILIWTPIIFAYYSGMRAVGLQPTWAMAGLVVCAAALSIAAPSSPGQVGVFHAGVTFALVQLLHQPQAPSASFAFLYHAINFAVVIVIGLFGIYRIGSTLGNVIRSTQQMFLRRKENVQV